MSDTVKVRLLVAAHVDDIADGNPAGVVLGAIDATIWDHREDAEDVAWRDRLWHEFGAERSDYQEREVWLTIDSDALGSVFQIADIEGQIES